MFPTLSLLSAYAGRRLPLGCFVNARVLRDHAKREAFAVAEQTRQALRCAAPLLLFLLFGQQILMALDTSRRTHSCRSGSAQRP